MKITRLGPVHYLNVQPLIYGLDRDRDFVLHFAAPSRCAEMLAAGQLELGMIPSIEYSRQPGYRIVPDICIASDGPVASVALFTTKPLSEVRTIAADTSSRTSVALLRMLCERRFHIDPEFEPMAPSPGMMLTSCDAALIIGDPALFLDHERLGATKIDLGAEWTAMTGLPFVWAFWAGPAGAVDAVVCARLQQAREEGERHYHEIARAYCSGDPARIPVAANYLRDNMRYELGARECRALTTYFDLASALGLAETARTLEFFTE
jgi:chorismate dehydratase